MSPTIIVYLILLLIALFIYGRAFSSGKPYIRILFFYLFLNLCLTILSMGIARFGVTNNLFLFHVFTPIEYGCICLFYLSIIGDPRIRRVIRISIPLFVLLCIVFAFFVQTLMENNSYIAIAESILIVCWTLLFLREVLLFNPVTALHNYPLFWITAGILIYFTENLVLDGVLSYLIKNTPSLAKLVYRVSFVFNDIFLIALSIGAMYQVRADLKETG
ncbi:hypothetical protein [Puia sp.]|jgi:hypothetical protein|uniref:hypothetical protein n=1 Tax=Puia sp. TaxID=2045100 RepID=UPI002F3FFF82